MRYRKRNILVPRSMYQAPIDFEKHNPDIDKEMIAVVTLWMFGGYSMKESWIIVYRPKCSPNSIAPQVSLFFGKKELKETVRIMKYLFAENPYINPKALDWEC